MPGSAAFGQGADPARPVRQQGRAPLGDPLGLINSIGLQNPGVQHFIDVELPEMLALKRQYGTVVIANLGGHSEEEYVEGAALLDGSAVDIVELTSAAPTSSRGAWPTASRPRPPARWCGWSAPPAASP